MAANDGHPPSYQRFPRDLIASLDGETDDFKLRYSYALDRSWDEHAYGVGSFADWCRWGLLGTPDESHPLGTLQAAYREALGRHTVAAPDGTIVQLRMARDRYDMAMRHRAAVESGKKRLRKRKGDNTSKAPSRHPVATLQPASPLASASASAVASATASGGEPKTGAARPAFTIPTLAEVEAYCLVRAAEGRRQVDPQAWFDHYTANGWRVGKNPMRDWRAAVRTWERGEYPSRGRPAGNGKMTGAQILAFAKTQEVKP